MIRKAVYTAISMSLVACGGSGADNAPLEPKPILMDAPPPATSIIFIGDSLFANWRPGLPANADRALTDLVPNSINLSIVGHTTAQIEQDEFPQALSLHPRTIVILAGANDLRTELSPDTLHISSMAEQASAQGIKVVICTVPPGNWWKVSDILTQANYLTAVGEWNTQLRNLSLTYGYQLIDFYSPMLDSYSTGPNDQLFYPPDFIEPNAQGYTTMWTILAPALM
jgi:lysophospholipase L1-like esterase